VLEQPVHIVRRAGVFAYPLQRQWQLLHDGLDPRPVLLLT
jgi:hypothetical protein